MPEGQLPLPCIDLLVYLTAEHEMLSFLKPFQGTTKYER